MSLKLFYPTNYLVPGYDVLDKLLFSPFVPSHEKEQALHSSSEFSRFLDIVERASRVVPREVGDKTVGRDSGANNFAYNFDLSGFEPKDIKVWIIGQKVVVEAETEVTEEKEGCHSFCHRQYHKTLMLPQSVKQDELKSSLSDKGVLRISAPLLAIEKPEEQTLEIALEKDELPSLIKISEKNEA